MTAILPLAETQFVDANGAPLAAGTVDFYVPGTTTRKNTYQDSSGTLNTNPVVLDAAGRAIIWGSGSYRQIVKDSSGNLIWDQVITAPYVASNIVITIATLADLQAEVADHAGQIIYRSDIQAPYQWNATSTATADGVMVVAVTGVTTGRWELQWEDALNVLWFGADNTAANNSNTAFQNAATAAYQYQTNVFVPAGNYSITAYQNYTGTTAGTPGSNINGNAKGTNGFAEGYSNGIQFIGAGKDRTFIAANIATTDPGFDFTGAAMSGFRDLRIDFDSASSHSAGILWGKAPGDSTSIGQYPTLIRCEITGDSSAPLTVSQSGDQPNFDYSIIKNSSGPATWCIGDGTAPIASPALNPSGSAILADFTYANFSECDLIGNPALRVLGGIVVNARQGYLATQGTATRFIEFGTGAASSIPAFDLSGIRGETQGSVADSGVDMFYALDANCCYFINFVGELPTCNILGGVSTADYQNVNILSRGGPGSGSGAVVFNGIHLIKQSKIACWLHGSANIGSVSAPHLSYGLTLEDISGESGAPTISDVQTALPGIQGLYYGRTSDAVGYQGQSAATRGENDTTVGITCSRWDTKNIAAPAYTGGAGLATYLTYTIPKQYFANTTAQDVGRMLVQNARLRILAGLNSGISSGAEFKATITQGGSSQVVDLTGVPAGPGVVELELILSNYSGSHVSSYAKAQCLTGTAGATQSAAVGQAAYFLNSADIVVTVEISSADSNPFGDALVVLE